ncbi:MAG: PfkB family carbohydrate kinase, partial [Oscillospiraceae bacterium]
MVDVTAIGELLVDFTQIKTEDDNGNSPIMQANAGGAPANFLAALSKFGVKTAMLAAVGDDLCGKMLVQKISDIGIETSGIKVTDKAFTTLAFVALDKHGDRSF